MPLTNEAQLALQGALNVAVERHLADAQTLADNGCAPHLVERCKTAAVSAKLFWVLLDEADSVQLLGVGNLYAAERRARTELESRFNQIDNSVIKVD